MKCLGVQWITASCERLTDDPSAKTAVKSLEPKK